MTQLLLALLLLQRKHPVYTSLGGARFCRVTGLALFCLLSFVSGPKAESSDRRPLTAVDAVQTARFERAYAFDNDASGVAVSPDGHHYVVELITGDAKRNGTWLTLLYGSLDTGGPPVTVARLFTDSLYRGDDIRHTDITLGVSPPRWLDNSRVRLFWEDRNGINQAYLLDVRTKKFEPLTNHPTNLSLFALDVNSEGTVLYTAHAPHSDREVRRLLDEGFVIANEDANSLVEGHIDMTSTLSFFWDLDWFIRKKNRPPIRLTVGPRPHLPSNSFVAKFSPNGRYAIIDDWPKAVPLSWMKYSGAFALRAIREALEISPDTFIAKQLKQLYLLDVSTREARPLLDVPGVRTYNEGVAWSPDSTKVLVGPTYLPVEDGDISGLSGQAVVEIDTATGKFVRLPLAIQNTDAAYDGITWVGNDHISIRTKKQTLYFVKHGSKWEQENSAHQLPKRPKAAYRVEVRQDLNTPPRLFAMDTATGKETMILDPNPHLASDFLLGRVELVRWNDPKGSEWEGLLYYPARYVSGQSYPLVIQTHGLQSDKSFSLYGYGKGLAGGYGPHAAQLLAGCDIMVLQAGGLVRPANIAPAEEAALYMQVYEAAARHFVDLGLVKKDKIGILGYSRTGWHVEYALTHSNFLYAAAIVADNITGEYLETTLLSPGYMEGENSGPPFGDNLKEWLARSPGFNAERVHTPLREELYSGPVSRVITHWELFSRLRRLGKPVEFYVMPDAAHGGHLFQNPRQIIAVKEGVVDWFDFWLNGHENDNPAKTAQYERWRKLRELHAANAGLMSPANSTEQRR